VDNFPILSTITFLPLAGALVIFLWATVSADMTRRIALVTSVVTFLASLVMLANFDTGRSDMQMTEHLDWLPTIGINYDMGVDGVSVLLVVMTTLLSILAIVQSFTPITKRVREYYIALLLLETGMIGVFLAIDLFLFYIFWELVLVPMALLIGIWGSTNRVYAAVKFFLYTLAGSLLMLVAIVATYQSFYNQTGIRTLNVIELAEGSYGHNFQLWVFAAFFIAFAIKVPMWPFHTWLPDAHVEAPTAGSVILAGVLLKMGGYGLIRFNLSLFPDASRDWAPYIMVLSVIAVIYGALVALVQPDLKKLIAYSSVSHMAFVTMGIFAFNMQGMYGAMIVMLSHGFVTGGLFLCVGVVYERAHTREISAFGGLATRMPVYASIFGVFMLASLGLPGLSNFVGEFLAIVGAFQSYRWAGVISMSVVVLSAWYMMWMFQRVIFERADGEPPDPGDNALPAVSGASADPPPPGHPDMPHEATVPGHEDTHAMTEDEIIAASNVPRWPDVGPRELATLVPLIILTIVLGVWPGPFMDIMQLTFEAILAPFGSVGV
jgi:NADH-quinone oxidoreductase subunit M